MVPEKSPSQTGSILFACDRGRAELEIFDIAEII